MDRTIDDAIHRAHERELHARRHERLVRKRKRTAEDRALLKAARATGERYGICDDTEALITLLEGLPGTGLDRGTRKLGESKEPLQESSPRPKQTVHAGLPVLAGERLDSEQLIAWVSGEVSSDY